MFYSAQFDPMYWSDGDATAVAINEARTYWPGKEWRLHSVDRAPEVLVINLTSSP
jgi:hypothetical protein